MIIMFVMIIKFKWYCGYGSEGSGICFSLYLYLYDSQLRSGEDGVTRLKMWCRIQLVLKQIAACAPPRITIMVLIATSDIKLQEAG